MEFSIESLRESIDEILDDDPAHNAKRIAVQNLRRSSCPFFTLAQTSRFHPLLLFDIFIVRLGIYLLHPLWPLPLIQPSFTYLFFTSIHITNIMLSA